MSPKHSLTGVEPTLRNRAGNHVWEIAAACISVSLGILVTVGASTRVGISHLPLWFMPTLLVYALGLMVGVGGLLTLVGLLVRRTHYTDEIHVEQIGQVLLGFGWASYVYATAYYTDNEMPSVIFGSVFSLACAARWLWLWVIERHDRQGRAKQGKDA